MGTLTLRSIRAEISFDDGFVIINWVRVTSFADNDDK